MWLVLKKGVLDKKKTGLDGILQGSVKAKVWQISIRIWNGWALSVGVCVCAVRVCVYI